MMQICIKHNIMIQICIKHNILIAQCTSFVRVGVSNSAEQLALHNVWCSEEQCLLNTAAVQDCGKKQCGSAAQSAHCMLDHRSAATCFQCSRSCASCQPIDVNVQHMIPHSRAQNFPDWTKRNIFWMVLY